MLQVQPRIWAYQLQLLCWPARLCADQGPFNLAHLGLGAALFVLAGAAAAVILLARRQRAVWLAAALIALPLLPVSNFVPIFRPLADRYLYFPLAGVALLVGLALQWAWLTRRYYLLALLPVLVGGLAFLTLQREAVWKNELALWCDTFIRNPRSFTAANNLGFACHQSGQYVRAVACWQRAVQLAGDREADPWAGLAIVYWRLGRREEAVRAYQRAVACNGDYARPEKLVAQLTWEPAAAAELAVVARQAERTAKSLTE
jgi:tetratricopeptide (TPR) repeat protein